MVGGSDKQWGGWSHDSKGTWELLFGAKPKPILKFVLLKFFGLKFVCIQIKLSLFVIMKGL